MSGKRLGFRNRARWHAVIGGLLVAVMLACPLLCRAGACCSAHRTTSTAEEIGEEVCPYCQQGEQGGRSRVPPLTPHKPDRRGRCLCSGAIVPVVASAPEQRDEVSRREVHWDLWTDYLSVQRSREAVDGVETRVTWGRRLCVAQCVLIC